MFKIQDYSFYNSAILEKYECEKKTYMGFVSVLTAFSTVAASLSSRIKWE